MNEQNVNDSIEELRGLYLRHCAKLIAEIWDKFGNLPDETFDNLGLNSGHELDFVVGYARAIEECEKGKFPQLSQILEENPKSA